MTSRNEATMMALIMDVAKDPRILAVLQDGSRSNPNVTPDIFQDFDIIYVVEDVAPFRQDHRWVDVFGERMIMQLPEDMELYPPAPELEGAFSYLLQFRDGNRIDLTLAPLARLEQFTGDSLCKVLWDKAGIFRNNPLPPASDAGYLVQKPPERSFTDCCNEFWYTNAGLAKGLWRGEVILAQELVNQVIRGALLQMMDWYIGCRHDFKVNTGKFGKYYERYLEPPVYQRLLATYPVADLQQIWEAVGAAQGLFRDAAQAVAAQLGYTYPEEWDNNVAAYMRHVRHLPKDAAKIYDGEAEAARGAFHYEQFLGPLYFEPYAIEVAKRIDPAPVTLALEIAAGTGRVTRHIRERMAPSATLIASDISEEMLAEARKKLGHLAIEWQLIDAGELPFGDERIDLVVCCFGYMFVPDRPKAFAEAWRVLKPGGVLLFTTWDQLAHNGIARTARALAEEYLGGPLPESYSEAVSMSDEGVIRPLLENAGFTDITIEKVAQSSVCPTAKEAAAGLVGGGLVFREVRQRYPERMEEVRTRLEGALAAAFGAAPMIAPMSAVICRARK